MLQQHTIRNNKLELIDVLFFINMNYFIYIYLCDLRDNCSIGDVGVVEEEGLQLSRCHLEAFVFDYFLKTVDDEELIVTVDESYIARV